MNLKTGIVCVTLVGTLAAAAGIDVRATYGARVTADEPQYLLTAISLGEDGNLDISDEIAEQRYLPFHELRLDPQTAPLPDGSEISPHDPLLPVLIAGPMELGGWRMAKLLLALMNGLLGAVMVWVAVRRFEVTEAVATSVVVVFVASAPLSVYGNQVYPELPAALAVTVAVAASTGRLHRAGLVSLFAAVVSLPWLSVKYVPVAACLAIGGIVRLARQGRRDAALGMLGALACAGVLFGLAHLEWYGGVTPYASGDHFTSTGEFSVAGTQVDLLGRSRRLVGLLIDNKFGLGVWQPAFLLAVPAMAALLASRPRGWDVLVIPSAAGWLSATFIALTMQGWWWPGRQVVHVVPLLVIAVAIWAGHAGRRSPVALAVGMLGIVSFAWFVVEGLRGSVTWVVDLYETSGPVYRTLAWITPDYLEVTARTWMLQGAWIAALGAWGYQTYRGAARGRVSAAPPSRDPIYRVEIT